KTLGIEKEKGKLFCGQVRWATFGKVDRENSQPHEVNCKQHIYGAHNGNITNCSELKEFLVSEGHNVVSNNDGEILVHMVEHYLDNELGKYDSKRQKNTKIRTECMRQAIIKAAEKMIGSYAAVIVDPQTENMYAIKAGSSLYFGIGEVEGINFGLASSDLTAVLRFTKNLVNLREGECVEFYHDKFEVFAFKKNKIRHLNEPDEIYESGDKVEKKVVRSKLRAEDTQLKPPYKFFMEQEIYAEVESSGKLVKLFSGGSNTGRRMLNLLRNENLLEKIQKLGEQIDETEDFNKQLKVFKKFENSDIAEKFFLKVKENYKPIYNELIKENFQKKYFFSSNKNSYIELVNSHFDKKKMLLAKALDAIAEVEDVKEFNKAVQEFLQIIKNTYENCGTIYSIACGTSYHATMVASLFFNEIAHTEIIPILPGNFRGQFSKSLHDNDVIIGVSQSGETKDLVDIFNDVDNSGLDIKKIVLVNNVNSTLGQEKSDVSIPINCGPEIAVPATKSFINQITLFYYLAIKLAEMKCEIISKKEPQNPELSKRKKEVENRKRSIEDIPALIKETLETSTDAVDMVASKIYMEPSMHILATKITGVAKEGALKIRETVLNHTEGGEASEFKHGPNTILGKNTVFGIKNIKAMLKHYNKVLDEIYTKAEERQIPNKEVQKLTNALTSYIFNRVEPFNLSPACEHLFRETMETFDFFQNAYRNYPLIYVTGPEERDMNLTISQINTHKIRGGDTFVIAEENSKLLNNARNTPYDKENKYYGWGYIPLPQTGDSLLTTFSATIVLQLLALKMSVRKMNKLNKMEIDKHGVHPDVPKNVSKSITVD
ncbi:MAG: SIS domain-containing protein, partial [Candidatus Cloacimonadota bacterium]|nr:SIS domain-containing protein [Candidatus Cloacimonadota bacterium]